MYGQRNIVLKIVGLDPCSCPLRPNFKSDTVQLQPLKTERLGVRLYSISRHSTLGRTPRIFNTMFVFCFTIVVRSYRRAALYTFSGKKKSEFILVGEKFSHFKKFQSLFLTLAQKISPLPPTSPDKVLEVSL